jgi:hypothetical protein
MQLAREDSAGERRIECGQVVYVEAVSAHG